MKILTVTLLALATINSAKADTIYNCGFYDLSASAQAVGSGPLTVVIKDGGKAEVYSEPQYNPAGIRNKIYDLTTSDTFGKVYSQTRNMDTTSFVRSSDEKAGVLKIESMMIRGDIGQMIDRSYICTK